MHADTLPITGPCPIDLDAIGFDRGAKVSHCTHCAKNVTNLSNMTRGEARAFMQAHAGERLCVSYACDDTGRIRFRPEPEPVLVPVARLRARPARAAGLVAALGVTAALAACTPHGEPPRQQPSPTVVVEGKIEVPPTDPVVKPQPDPIPMAGAAVMPPEIMMDGEIAVPDPKLLDEPCDGPKTKTKPAPKAKPEPEPEPVMRRGEVAM
jgi:hypothetical protein